MKKIRNLALILICCLFFFGGVSNNSTLEVKANTETTENVTFEDLDNDGIPDIINDYYDEHIRDQYMFGIGLGAILGVFASIISAIYIAKKNNTSVNALKATNEKTNEKLLEIIKDLYNKVSELKEENDRIVTLNNKYVNDYKLLASEIINSNEKSTKVLKNYAKVNDKLDIALECIEEISKAPELLKEGITSKVVAKIKGVK